MPLRQIYSWLNLCINEYINISLEGGYYNCLFAFPI